MKLLPLIIVDFIKFNQIYDAVINKTISEKKIIHITY